MREGEGFSAAPSPLLLSSAGPGGPIQPRHFRLSGRSASSRGRPLLHETLLLGSRNAIRTTEHAETQKIAIGVPRPEDPLTMSHFGPPDSIRRRVGRPLSRGGLAQLLRGGLAQLLRAGHTGRKASCTGAGRGRAAEHAETQKIAIWRPRPGDPS